MVEYAFDELGRGSRSGERSFELTRVERFHFAARFLDEYWLGHS